MKLSENYGKWLTEVSNRKLRNTELLDSPVRVAQNAEMIKRKGIVALDKGKTKKERAGQRTRLKDLEKKIGVIPPSKPSGTVSKPYRPEYGQVGGGAKGTYKSPPAAAPQLTVKSKAKSLLDRLLRRK